MVAKISVIVPIYNVEKYLSKCIDSIINQTYTNLEIILVNDGSPDNGGRIADEYAALDNRIKVIHKENGGLSDARNAGLDIASGEYIGFIDSDDYIHKEFYETLINGILSYDADISQCDFIKIYEDGTNNTDFNEFSKAEQVAVLAYIDALNNLYKRNYASTVVVWNKLYKRKLFDNIRFPKGKIHEDEYTTYKIFYEAQKILVTSRQLYYYLQRSDSIMGQSFSAKRLDALQAFYEQILFYEEKGLSDLESKSKKRLESTIRGQMCKVLDSDLSDKNYYFDYLVNYYRQNYTLFRISEINGQKRILTILYNYSPKFIVRWMCALTRIKRRLQKK